MTGLEEARAALRDRQGAGARYDAPDAPAQSLHLARRGVAYLARIVNGLSDSDLLCPSARTGWSRRRVIAANALQAREIAQALEDAAGHKGDRAETGPAALDLAETLPARALRHLANHADIHLNVVWRDLSDAEWNLPVALSAGTVPARATAALRADRLWRDALDLAAGGRLRDVPGEIRDMIKAAPAAQTV